jgi:hypothetical protein
MSTAKHHRFGFGSFLAILLALGLVMMLTPSGDKSVSTSSVQRVASDGIRTTPCQRSTSAFCFVL